MITLLFELLLPEPFEGVAVPLLPVDELELVFGVAVFLGVVVPDEGFVPVPPEVPFEVPLEFNL